jgi:hypothetical protein
MEGYPLTLEEGKKYNIRFNTAQWKDNGTLCRFEILNEYEERVFVQMINNTPNMNGGTGAVNGSALTEISFTPESTGNYLIRWSAATSEDGGTGFFEILLGNPSVMYIPNIAGVEVTQMLNNALANAKAARDGNSDERYAGPAYDALVRAIEKYDAEAPNYTAPSAYKSATEALEAATQAMKDHRTLCDTYDPLPKQAQEIVDNNASKKFAGTSLYGELATVAAKYVTKTTETQTDPETQETTEVVVNNVKELKDDAELQAAIDELKILVNTAGLSFTEGE